MEETKELIQFCLYKDTTNQKSYLNDYPMFYLKKSLKAFQVFKKIEQ